MSGHQAMSNPGIGDLDDHGGLDMLTQEDRFEVFMPAVQTLVNALGGYEEMEDPDGTGALVVVYRPGDSVLPVLKDLKKLWRKDDTDDERTVARCMHQASLMKELVAIVKECTFRGDWGRKVSLMACDLIAALTWPIDVAQELKEMEDEGDIVPDYASLLRAQIEYKALLLNTDTLRSILSLILPCFAKSPREEKEERIISLCLHIVRNMLAIKDLVTEDRATGEKQALSMLQSGLIVQLDQLTFLELFLTLASEADKSEFNSYNVLVLDILHLIFRGVKPYDLAQDQSTAPSASLAKLLDGEQRKKVLSSKKAHSRHSRFGTTIQVKSGQQRIILHNQSAITANPGEVLDQTKKKKAQRVRRGDELTVNANLTPAALIILQKFTREFLESSFNNFVESVLKDIRMERSKVRPADTIRALLVMKFCVDYLLLIRKAALVSADAAAKQHPDGPDNADKPMVTVDRELPLGWVAEVANFDSVRWVVARMKISMDDKPPAWTELQASIDCFTQVLLLTDAMGTSSEEEDVEVAEILQNQLYYNGDVLDASLDVVQHYKNQSVGYLDSIVHFAYVLLRMLEKYSKGKSFMFVRKRKAARKQRQAVAAGDASVPEEDFDDEGDYSAPDKNAQSYKEHAFTFTKFEKRFAHEEVTETLMAYLERYRGFEDPDQIRRVVGLMHRQVVKSNGVGLYFKISILQLFRRILDDQGSLPKGEGSKDLIQLINFVLRKFFKKLAEDPFVMVEVFSPTSRNGWKTTKEAEAEGADDGMAGQRDRIREQMGPVELEFIKNKKLSWSQQMGVIVRVLQDEGHESWVKWTVEVLEIALAARTEVVLAVDGVEDFSAVNSDGERAARDFSGPSADAKAKFSRHDLDADTDERREAVSADQHMRLMLKLLHFEVTEAESPADQRWFLPPSVLPSVLSTSIGALNQFLAAPMDLNDDPKSLLRKKRRNRRAITPGSGSDEEPRPPRRRKAVNAAEMQSFKSAAFIYDSDDDEEADGVFFAREALLRAEMEALARESGSTMRADGGTKKRKRKGDKNAIEHIVEDEHADEDVVEAQTSQFEASDEDLLPQDAVIDEGSEGGDEDDSPAKRKKATSPAGRPPANSSHPASSPPEPMWTQRRRRVVDPDDSE